MIKSSKQLSEATPVDFWMGDMASYLLYGACLQTFNDASPELRTTWARDYGSPKQEEEDRFDGYDYMIQQIGSIAVLEISGPLVPKSSFWTRIYGMTGYDEIRNAMIAIANEGSSKSILMDINSPGGAVTGLSEASEAISMINSDLLPVYGHTSGQMTSAAYRLAAAARDVTATRMSEVGSIGVLAIHQEITKMLEDYGVTTKVFRAGKFKALGNMYEKLSQLAIDEIEGQMAFLYDDFTQEVATNRGVPVAYIREHSAEGKVFYGSQALDVKLIDRVDTFEAVVKHLESLHNSQPGGQVPKQPVGAQTMLRKKRVILTEEAQAALASGADPASILVSLQPAPEEQKDSAPAPAPAPAAEEPEEQENQEEQEEQVPAASTVSVDFLSQQLEKTQADLINARVALQQATDKLKTVEDSQAGLIGIAIKATQRMMIPLGMSAIDMSTMSATALITQFNSVEETFMSRMRVGSTAEVTTEHDDNDIVVAAPNPGVVRATRIRTKEDKA